MNTPPVDAAAASSSSSRQNAVARILGSATFAGSARLCAFLRFICDEASAGRAERLNEHAIGTRVFGRPEGFNPADDSIVRSNARLLRQRLARYYEDEGAADLLRVAIPRGSYVPVFIDAAAARAAATVPEAPPREAPRTQETQVGREARKPRRGVSRREAFMALAGAGASAGVSLALTAPWRSPPADAAAALWRALLVPDRDLLVVPADSGLVMWQSEHRRALPLDDYIASRPLALASDAAGSAWPAGDARRYTGVVSVRLAVEMTRRAEAAAARVRVRFARDLRLHELKEANAVLIGAGNSNPWTQLFDEQCVFRIDLDGEERFVATNRAPLPGELPRYVQAPGGVDPAGYARIALKRNLGGSGRVLLVGGTGSAGTDAGIDFLLDPVALPRALEALNPRAAACDGFEILLRTRLRGSGGTGHEVLAARFSPQVA